MQKHKFNIGDRVISNNQYDLRCHGGPQHGVVTELVAPYDEIFKPWHLRYHVRVLLDVDASTEYKDVGLYCEDELEAEVL